MPGVLDAIKEKGPLRLKESEKEMIDAMILKHGNDIKKILPYV